MDRHDWTKCLPFSSLGGLEVVHGEHIAHTEMHRLWTPVGAGLFSIRAGDSFAQTTRGRLGFGHQTHGRGLGEAIRIVKEL